MVTKKIVCCILAFTGVFVVFAQKKKETNYLIYHDWINNAESFYFLESNYDSAAYYYKKAFSNFDFVFVKDCIIAAELAAANKKKEDFLFFTTRGFERGWRLEDMTKLAYTGGSRFVPVNVFNSLLTDKSLHDYLAKEYPLRRKKYLASIEVSLREKLVDMFMEDELNKNVHMKQGEKFEDRYMKHAKVVQKNNLRLDSIVKKVGFPGEKLTGIENDHLMEELGCKGKDPLWQYDHYYYKYADSLNIDRKMFSLDEDEYTCKILYVLLIHASCSYWKYQSVFPKNIATGNIHPRDVAFLLDFMINDGPAAVRRKHTAIKKYLGCSIDTNAKRNYTSGLDVVDAPEEVFYDVNQYRKKWHIVPIEVDIAKRKYELEAGVQLFFGFFNHL
ncbi:hypothetical protein [Taibaiella soli]|uniref:Uncharacterized protein n=1 Tax=Taibaiella soli TaxID=1649169 RepID=A0A2W2B1F5_9BACT|nr:hypothetical protein [Taibaiella soli]PZF73828.1 hypothetical protein DN068_05655 [Taibaiella soli]